MSFSKEDFLTLFQLYDEYGTAVLQSDNLEMFSPAGRALLMQDDAKTVVYAAMYTEGEYQGAVAHTYQVVKESIKIYPHRCTLQSKWQKW